MIHIGVNTCKLAVVTESMWRQLIRKLKHVFPEAAVLVSSIVPPMGRLRKTVQVSNAALLAVCNREKVSVVNDTDAFTAQSGAPRKHVTNDISFHARVGRFSPFSYLRSVAIAVILFWLRLVVLISPCFLGSRIPRDHRFPRAPLFLCSERKSS